jgi:hypothetical protein
VTISLGAEGGPKTCFKVYGSPCTPKVQNWAFQYGDEVAVEQWNGIPADVDIVVTHTPPKGHCDAATKDDRTGCRVLLQALHRVRPMLAVCGHIHEARGVERVRWNLTCPEDERLISDTAENTGLVDDSEIWTDPGVGSNKQSLVNLTEKGGRPLANCSRLTRQRCMLPTSELGGRPEVSGVPQPSDIDPTSRTTGVSSSEAKIGAMRGGAYEHRQASCPSDVGLEPDVEATERKETAIINAALLGPRISGRASKVLNKPIVVDVDLPVWCVETEAE